MSMIDIDLTFPDLAKVLRDHEKELEVFVAAQMQFNRGMLFEKEGAYNGHEKWKKLKFRVGQILSKRGTLRKSMAPTAMNGKPGNGGIVKFGNGIVTIGSNLIYASLMNFGTTKLPGGVLKPKKAKALMIPIPGGKGATDAAKGLRKRGGGAKTIERDVGGKTKKSKVIFVQSVKIPERRFDQWNKQDQQELSVALRNKVVEILNK